MTHRIATLSLVLAALCPAAASAQSQGGFSARPPSGSFADLAAGRLTVPIHCPSTCTVAARLTVPAQDARRMVLPFWKTNQLLANEDDNDSFEAGDHRLGLELVDAEVRRSLVPSLLFPLLGRVRVKVELQADFDEGGSATPSVTGWLRWPRSPVQRGGRGAAGLVRSISGPASVPLGSATAGFAVRLRQTSAQRVVRAGLVTAGGLLSTRRAAFSLGTRRVGAARLRRGGAFTVRVPLRGKRLDTARSFAPLPAQVYVDVVDSASGAVVDHGIRRFTLTG